MTMVELGCCQGDTTKVFSSLFKEVYAYDWSDDNIKEVRKNISYVGQNTILFNDTVFKQLQSIFCYDWTKLYFS